ncbi:hypothetical protein OQA88_4606 [Cercophora sp. LCS_1]
MRPVPFPAVTGFHDHLVAPVKKSPRPDWAAKYRSRLPDRHDVRFSHADLSWSNILLDRETGNVTGILDWEMAGFFPAWWEYRKSLDGARCRPWWIQIMDQLMDQLMDKHPEETEADMDLEMF